MDTETRRHPRLAHVVGGGGLSTAGVESLKPPARRFPGNLKLSPMIVGTWLRCGSRSGIAVAATGSPPHLAPFVDRPVRRDRDAATLVAARDELEEQMRGMGREGQATEFVDDQQLRRCRPGVETSLPVCVTPRLMDGKFTRSLFLQHKVASFAEVRAGRNALFSAAHNQPYFRFPIDNEQHNVLCKLSRTQGNAFYCAPRFHLTSKLKEYFRDVAIAENAVLLNPLDVGEVTGKNRHNVTYDVLGQNPTLHSELRYFKHSYSGGERNAPAANRQRITLDYIQELSAELEHSTEDSKFFRSLPMALELSSPIKRAQFLLGRVYQVTWLLLP